MPEIVPVAASIVRPVGSSGDTENDAAEPSADAVFGAMARFANGEARDWVEIVNEVEI